jgi:GntR family transcriptional regulator/MocR family aminotransferase
MSQLDDLKASLAGESPPSYRDIARALERWIRDGRLADGLALPPSRRLAEELGVNRTTVVRAYRLLDTRGLVEARVGSGTRVRSADVQARADAAPAGPAAVRPAHGMLALARSAAPEDFSSGAAASPIDFSLMLPDAGLFPLASFRKVVNRVLREADPALLQYGPPAGLRRLREAVARRLEQRGLRVKAEELVIVNGVQQALDLLCKALLDPGDTVVVEAPTYSNLLPLLSLYRARVRAVPMTPDGVDRLALERTLADADAKFFYTIPSFHNPTGVTMNAAARAGVARLAARHGTLVVEDGYEDDLRYTGEPVKPLAAFDDGGHTVYLGTFSKGLFPGLRMGYVACRNRELRELLVLAKLYADYHADGLAQAVLAEFLEAGHYDRHLEKLRAVYRERLQTTVAALRRHFPPQAGFSFPEGGFTVWVSLPAALPASEVFEAGKRSGVLVTPGRHFFHGEALENGLRLTFSQTDPDRIEEGIERLGRLLKRMLKQRRPAAEPTGPEIPGLV